MSSEKRTEFIKIEGGKTIGGKVVFDDPDFFTELPKISILPITKEIVSVSLIKRSTKGFTYKVMIKKWWRWKNETKEIPILWLAIQEK